MDCFLHRPPIAIRGRRIVLKQSAQIYTTSVENRSFRSGRKPDLTRQYIRAMRFGLDRLQTAASAAALLAAASGRTVIGLGWRRSGKIGQID